MCCGATTRKADYSAINNLIDHLEALQGNVPLEVFHQFKRLVEAGIRWSGAGFPTCTEEEFDARLGICRTQCTLWDDAARLGFGRCGHEKCGCTRAKHWLKTEFCPDGKW